MATLADLSTVRSQRALRLRAHLEWIRDGGPWMKAPWFDTPDQFLDTFVMPRVYRLRAGADVEGDGSLRDKSEDREAARLREEDLARAPKSSGEPEGERWTSVWPGLRRAIVLGRAGEGKSTLLQWTAREVARISLERWHAQDLPLEAIPLPLVLQARQIALAGSLEAAFEVALALGRDAPRWSRVTPAGDGLTLPEMQGALAAEPTWLFVDAMDERPPEAPPDNWLPGTPTSHRNKAENTAALATLAKVPCRMLLSGRRYDWGESRELLPFVTDDVGPEDGERQAQSRVTSGVNDGSSAPLRVLALAKMNEERKQVVDRWYPPGVPGTSERRQQLLALLDVKPMLELTNNALLLTLLCVAARRPTRQISAATRRAELYNWLVHDFLARPDSPAVAADPESPAVQQRAALLARVAWGLWHVTSGGDSFTFAKWAHEVSVASTGGDDPVVLLAQIQATGLLMGGAQLSFFPRTVFEYLAGAGLMYAAAVARPNDATPAGAIADVLVKNGHDDGWLELVKLAVGYLAVVEDRRDAVTNVVRATVERSSVLPNEERGRLAATLGEAIIEAGELDPRLPGNLTGGPAAPKPVLTKDTTRVRLRELLQATMENTDPPGAPGQVPAVVRARAGAALGWLGDPRFDPKMFWLPSGEHAGFASIPGGWFMMGSPDDDRQARSRERPMHREEVPAFLMARWPVTMAQWATYHVVTGRTPADPRSVSGAPAMPAVSVSATDAESFTAWLSMQFRDGGALEKVGRDLAAQLGVLQIEVRLPTEAEWEYVAKGGLEGRPYPYGHTYDKDAANGVDAKVGGVSAVGSFALGAATMEGQSWPVEELSGNCLEWTCSAWRQTYEPNAPEDPEGRVVRGGAFDDNARNLRSADRFGGRSAGRYSGIGFRVVVSPFRS